MPSVVIASRNRKKFIELAELLQPYNIRLFNPVDFPQAPHVEESGETFAENAALKASETARALGHWTLADDSGLMVDALGGAPGVYSARYAGPGATDAENNAKLLRELADVPIPQRQAQFVCHLAVADSEGEIRLRAEGICRGLIVPLLLGSEGFGYDPLFLIPEYGETFGQLSPLVKSQLSHRARALRQLVPRLARLLEGAEGRGAKGHRDEG
jgi:XTP/dITP diphosphohydrolase